MHTATPRKRGQRYNGEAALLPFLSLWFPVVEVELFGALSVLFELSCELVLFVELWWWWELVEIFLWW